MLAPKLLGEVLHELNDFDRHSQQEMSRISLVHGSCNMSSSSPFRKVIQKLILSEADGVAKMKFKIKHTQTQKKF